jgi:hypothetical protein
MVLLRAPVIAFLMVLELAPVLVKEVLILAPELAPELKELVG